jgi:chitodextrinase
MTSSKPWRFILISAFSAAWAISCSSDEASDDRREGVDIGNADGGPDATVPPVVFHASPTGTGETCSLEAPCSLLDAQKKVRAISRDMRSDVIVNLADGTYVLAQTLVFSTSLGDSGMNGHSVIYQAKDLGSPTPAKPVFSGGRTIRDFKLHDAAKNIFKADVADLETRQLYVNDVRALRARQRSGIPGTLTQIPGGYRTTSTAPQSWANAGDIELVFHDGSPDGNWLWAEPRCPIAAITGDAGGTTISIAQPCFDLVTTPRGGTKPPTAVEHFYAALTEKGTFYLDRSKPGAHVLYYIPRDDEDMAKATVIAPVLETLVKGDGKLELPVHDIQLKGITFAHATWLGPSTPHGFPESSYNKMGNTSGPETQVPGNVDFYAGRNLRFEGDTFIHLGGVGLNLDDGSQNNVVVGNVFTDISSNGIQIGNVGLNASEGPGLVTDNSVENNYVHDIGVEYPGAYGIWNANTQRTTVTHNVFAHLPRGGIATNYTYSSAPRVANGHRFTFNVIEDYMNGIRDGGGFDTNGSQNGIDGIRPNSVLAGNVFREDHNNFGQIYLDFNSSGYTLDNNVAYASASLDYNTIDAKNQACCNQHRYNFYDQNNAFKYQVAQDMVVGNTTVPPAAMPASILERAGLEPAYRHLLPSKPPTDTVPPAAPTGLRAEATGAGPSVSLSWSAATDNVGVTGYEIDHGETVLGAVVATSTKATVPLLVPGTKYTLVVRARDAAGNLSPPSNAIDVDIPGSPDLVGHWTFDQAAPSATDASGSANAGAISGATSVAGKNGMALDFNGAGQFVSMGNAYVLNQDRHGFSVSLWFKSTATGWRRMVTKGNYANSSGYLLQYDSGAIAFGVGSNGTVENTAIANTPGGFGDGNWHHVVGVVDRTEQSIRVYVDGVARQVKPSDGFCGTANGTALSIAKCTYLGASSNEPFTVGSYNGTAEFFQGSLDDIRVYSRAIGAADVANLFMLK